MATAEHQRKGVFRFLDLPAELRNRIYGLAMTASGPVTLSLGQRGIERDLIWTGTVYCRDGEGGVKPKEMGLGLLLACKQVYSEAKDFPYHDTVFVFERLPAVGKFVEYIGDRRLHVTEVRVKWEPSECDHHLDTTASVFALLPGLKRLVFGLKNTNLGHKGRYIHQGHGRRLAQVIRPFLNREEDAAERRKMLKERVEIREQRMIATRPATFSRVQPWKEHKVAAWTLDLVAEKLVDAGVLAAS